MHRAGRTVSQAPRMVGMRVGEHDRAGAQPLEFSQPIKAAIDHQSGAAIRDQQRAMHIMPSRPRLDLPARAKKREFHRSRLSLFSDRHAIFRVGKQNLPK